jgi:hypothetical protein
VDPLYCGYFFLERTLDLKAEDDFRAGASAPAMPAQLHFDDIVRGDIDQGDIMAILLKGWPEPLDNY